MPARIASIGCQAVRTRPSTSMAPPSGVTTPARILISVDLPLPFSPAKQTISLRLTATLTSCRAWTPANALLMPLSWSRGPDDIRSSRYRRTIGGQSASTRQHYLLERILGRVFLGHVDPSLAVDHLAVQLDVMVAVDPEVHAVGDLLPVEEHHRDLLHEIAGVSRIPEVDRLDRAALEVLASDRRQAGADDAGLVLEAALLDRETDTGDVGGGAALETFEVRVLAQQLLRLGVCLLLVVIGLVAIADQFHVRVLFILLGDGFVDPLIMRL